MKFYNSYMCIFLLKVLFSPVQAVFGLLITPNWQDIKCDFIVVLKPVGLTLFLFMIIKF